MKLLNCLALLSLTSTIPVTGQMLERPAVYRVESAGQRYALLQGAAPPSSAPQSQQVFSTGNVTVPTNNKSQFGASSQVYSVSVYGTPKCTKDALGNQTCVSQYWFKVAVNANVVNTTNDVASSIREYLFSQNGSPLSLSIPSHTWTTKKGDVRQSWLAFSLVGSGRLIPLAGSSNSTGSGTSTGSNTSTATSSSLTGGGSASIGGTGQVDIEFDATEPGNDPSGTDTVYPGTIYLSVTPSVSAAMGGPLKAAIFQNAPVSSWTWGGDFRGGFQFKGKKPISLGITGTFSAKGLTSSSKGFALSLSKLFGGSL